METPARGVMFRVKHPVLRPSLPLGVTMAVCLVLSCTLPCCSQEQQQCKTCVTVVMHFRVFEDREVFLVIQAKAMPIWIKSTRALKRCRTARIGVSAQLQEQCSVKPLRFCQDTFELHFFKLFFRKGVKLHLKGSHVLSNLFTTQLL